MVRDQLGGQGGSLPAERIMSRPEVHAGHGPAGMLRHRPRIGSERPPEVDKMAVPVIHRFDARAVGADQQDRQAAREWLHITPSGRTRALARRTPSCSRYILGIPPWA